MPMPWSCDRDRRPSGRRPRPRTSTSSRRRSTSRRCRAGCTSADTSWRRSPTTVRPARRLGAPRCAMPRAARPRAGCGRRPRRRRGATRHRLAARRLVGLDAAQLEQVVDGAADAERLGRACARPALGDHAASSSASSVSASRPARRRRLQLVADVGDEVAAHGLEPPPLGDVVDDHDAPPTAGRRIERRTRTGADRALRWGRTARCGSPVDRRRVRLEQLLDGRRDQRLRAPAARYDVAARCGTRPRPARRTTEHPEVQSVDGLGAMRAHPRARRSSTFQRPRVVPFAGKLPGASLPAGPAPACATSERARGRMRRRPPRLECERLPMVVRLSAPRHEVVRVAGEQVAQPGAR